MTTLPNRSEVFTRFLEIAERFCAAVDSAPHVNKEDLVFKSTRYSRSLSVKP